MEVEADTKVGLPVFTFMVVIAVIGQHLEVPNRLSMVRERAKHAFLQKMIPKLSKLLSLLHKHCVLDWR